MAQDINFPSGPVSSISQIGPERPSFDFKGTCYPMDLFEPNSQYGNNYMVFYINIHEDSQFAKDAMGESERVAAGLAPSFRDNMAGLSPDAIGRAVQLEAAAAGAAATAGLTSKYGIELKPGTKIFGANPGGQLLDTLAQYTVVAAGGAAVGAVAKSLIPKKAAYKTSRQAIALYVPEVSTTYSTSWGEAETGMSQAIGKGLEGTGWDGTLEGVGAAALKAGENIANAASSYITSAALAQSPFASKASGLASNPKKEQLFREVSFRQHQFKYTFAPRSPAEAKAVIDIIKAFKLHMHPEFKPGFEDFVYIYPSEFDICYYNKGVENKFLPKYTSCALTSMNVYYGDGRGNFVTFDDVYMGELINGMPVQISISLNFQELALLTKETVDQGY